MPTRSIGFTSQEESFLWLSISSQKYFQTTFKDRITTGCTANTLIPPCFLKNENSEFSNNVSLGRTKCIICTQWRHQGWGAWGWGGISPPSRRLFPHFPPLEEKMAKISHFRQFLVFWPPSETHFAPQCSLQKKKKKFWCRHCLYSVLTLYLVFVYQVLSASAKKWTSCF